MANNNLLGFQWSTGGLGQVFAKATGLVVSTFGTLGLIPAVVTNAQIDPGSLVVHRIDIADAASADTDVVLTYKTRVIDMHVVKTAGAGAASNTITLKNGSTAITNALDTNVADKVVVRAGTIDDASYEVAAGGTLRVSSAKSGGNCACTVYVTGILVA